MLANLRRFTRIGAALYIDGHSQDKIRIGPCWLFVPQFLWL
jgi:hypothetical protein